MYKVVIIVFCIQFCSATNSLKEEEVATEAEAVCFDVDRDGKISKDEIATFLSRHKSFDKLVDNDGGRTAFINKHFIANDLDGDGILYKSDGVPSMITRLLSLQYVAIICNSESTKTASVYMKVLKDCLKGGHITELSSKRPKSTNETFAMFECYDLNDDGMINQQEVSEFYMGKSSYKDILNAVGGLDKFVARLMRCHDANGDGFVSWQEFESVVKIYLHVLTVCHGKV